MRHETDLRRQNPLELLRKPSLFVCQILEFSGNATHTSELRKHSPMDVEQAKSSLELQDMSFSPSLSDPGQPGQPLVLRPGGMLVPSLKEDQSSLRELGQANLKPKLRLTLP